MGGGYLHPVTDSFVLLHTILTHDEGCLVSVYNVTHGKGHNDILWRYNY